MSDKKPDSNGVAELPESSSASSAATRLPAAFEQLALTGGKQKTKPKYAFWATQPVAQFDEDPKAVGVSQPALLFTFTQCLFSGKLK